MNQNNNLTRSQTSKITTKDKINLDYDFNTEYGDGDIPDIDKPGNKEPDATSKKN